MNSILVTTDRESKKTKDLLGKKVPSYRKAYSDRTAWLMACFSELAYVRFNPPFALGAAHAKSFIKKAAKFASKKKGSALLGFIGSFIYDHSKEEKKLRSELGIVQFKLLKTFDENGTQAILASNGKHLVLAFRGTEANSIKDIKADANAKIRHCETGGKIHSGFDNAFKQVSSAIQATLNKTEYKTMPLFITGHSLGGALATVAAKKLSHKGGIAACYTFGSPRVGNEKWISNIKVPIYRLVNSADCVTMLPPGSEIIQLLQWIAKIAAPRSGKMLGALLSHFAGYIHAGNMRYLTNCSAGKHGDVRLLYSVSFFYRIKGFLIKKLPWKKFLADHSISIYRKKLMIVAEQRNLKRD